MKRPVKFGDYYLFQRIAVGGMAEVFRAASFGVEGFERIFAIKRVLPQIAEDQEFIDMFIDEAKIAVQLSHANIGQVFELGNADDSYFIAMEFVAGRDARALYDRIRSRGERLDISMCCHIVKEVCEALEYAHMKRNEVGEPLALIHRDVSPQNILISYEGEVKLIDFGIAKAAGKANKTKSGILKGKFGYMSPEQVRGKPIDRRSDLFSLATVLYELLTLERCFQGSDDFSTLERVRKVDFKRPTLLNRAIPPELERIIYRGLTRNPADRFQSAAEFQDALQKYLYQSGSFYSRKDLSRFMKETFARELNAENQAIAQFREHAKNHILVSDGPNSIPMEDFSMDSLLESVDINVSDVAMSDSDTDTDRDISLLDRSTEERVPAVDRPKPRHEQAASYPSDAPTIPRQDKQLPKQPQPPKTSTPAPTPPQDSGRRLMWLVIVTMLAIIAGALVVKREVEELKPGLLKLHGTVAPVQIYIDGQLRHDGKLPVVLKQLAPGRHAIDARADGYTGYRTEVDIEAARETSLRIKLELERPQTSMTLKTHPAGATLFVDDKKMEETPVRVPDIKPGRRRLRLEKAGYTTYEGTVNIVEGKETRIDPIRLFPSAVTFLYVADPPNAQISIRHPGQEWKVLGASPQTVTKTPNTGQHRVRASAPGYNTVERRLPKVFTLRHEEVLTLTAVSTTTNENSRVQRKSPTRKSTNSRQKRAKTSTGAAPRIRLSVAQNRVQVHRLVSTRVRKHVFSSTEQSLAGRRCCETELPPAHIQCF